MGSEHVLRVTSGHPAPAASVPRENPGQPATYASDVYSIVNGGFGAELFDEEPSKATLWLDYPDGEITLAPDGVEVISFEVSVPDDTPPGEYITSVVAENADPLTQSGQDGIAIEQVNRTAVAVAIDVPGSRHAQLEVGGVTHALSAGTSVVSFRVTNAGNVHLVPTGSFTLRDDDRPPLAESAVNLDTLYAGTSTTVELPLEDALPSGEYCAELALADRDAGARAATECVVFSVGPGSERDASELDVGPIVGGTVDAVAGNGLLAVLVALAAVAGVVVLVLVRRRRPSVREQGRPR